MSDVVVSALKGATYSGLVSITEAGATGMITLRGDIACSDFAGAVTNVTGCALPSLRQMATNGTVSVLWMSPDELLILCPYDQAPAVTAKLSTALSNLHALVVDVSDARAMFALEGAGIRDVFAKLTPANLAPDALPVGEVRRTKIAQVAAGFWLCDETSARLICFRSSAPYMFGLLKTAASEDAAVGFHI